MQYYHTILITLENRLNKLTEDLTTTVALLLTIYRYNLER